MGRVSYSLPRFVLFFSLAAVSAAAQPVPEPPPVPGLSVVVTGTRTPRRMSDDPVGTEVIGARELDTRGVRDASDALEAEPGIQLERSFRGSSFQLRGLDAKYVRILVDGLPVTGQVNDVIDLRRYALEGIEKIEIVRGATSALYGSDALAGVVNLISRKPTRALELGGFAQYGSVNTSVGGITAGTRHGDFAGSLSLNWFGNDSWDNTPNDGNPATSGDARRVGLATARLFWDPSEKFEMMFTARGGTIDSRGVDFQPPRALYNRQVEETEGALALQATWKPDELTRVVGSLQTNGFWRSFDRVQRQAPNHEEMHSLERILRGEVQADRTLTGWLEVTGGAGGQDARLTSPRLAGGGDQVLTGWAFAQAEAVAGPLRLVAGTRLDFDSQFGTHLSPRVAARVEVPGIQGLNMRLSYGEGFRAPSFGERYLLFRNQVANYIVYGNEALSPETSKGAQVALEYAPRALKLPGGFVPNLRLAYHHTALDGLIQPRETQDSNAAEQRFQYVNYSDGRVTGIEASASFRLRDRLMIDAGYAYLSTRATFEGQVRALPGRAENQATLSVIWRRPSSGTEVSVRQQLLLGRAALEDDTELPLLYTADVRVSQRVWKATTSPSEASVYAAAENLAGMTDALFLQLPGRTFNLGVSARY